MSELPRGWASAAVQELASNEPGAITDGPFGSALKRNHYTRTGARVVRLSNLRDGAFVDDDRAYVSLDHYRTLQRHTVLPGDILVAALGDPLGRSCRAPDDLGPAIVKADCYRLRLHSDLSAPLLVRWLNAPQAREALTASSHGLGRVRINLGDLKRLALPVPPLPEQRRIVAKIDSLSAKSRRARDHLDHIPRLVAKYKQAILAAAFRGELTRAWRRRVGRNDKWQSTTLGTLLTDLRYGTASHLDQAILAKAFRGELVPQDPTDEPASKLLDRIKTERQAVPQARRKASAGR